MSSSDLHSYESRWDFSSATTREAMLAVDGSCNEEVLKLSGRWTARQLRSALDLRPTDTVFELGCGVGRIASELVDHCAQWHGADISANMLEVARKRLVKHDNAHLHKLTRSSLENLEDNFFDKVYCVAVFIHLDKEDVFLYLRELARVLKPGGIAYLETWNLASETGWKRWMLEVDHWAHGDQRGRKDVSRNQFCHPGEFRLYLEHAGLRQAAVFDQSAWLQVVAAKAGSDGAVESLRSHVAEHADIIGYSANWDHLFGLIVDILAGRRDIQRVLADLESRLDDEETRLIYEHLKAQV